MVVMHIQKVFCILDNDDAGTEIEFMQFIQRKNKKYNITGYNYVEMIN